MRFRYWMAMLIFFSGAQVLYAQAPPCSQSVQEIQQLPLVPNTTFLRVPVEMSRQLGSWQYRSNSGAWIDAPPSLMSGTAPVGGDSYTPSSPCLSGPADIADRCFLWKPGAYTVRWLARDGSVPIGPITLVIEEPRGVDKEVYEKLLVPRITGPLLGQDLLFWVYGNFNRCKDRPPVASTILAEYPSSTYAGYVLARNAVGFSSQPLFWLDDPNANMLRYHHTPGGQMEAPQIDSEKAAMAAYAKSAGPFLDAHPDFVQAPLIRRTYAMCLGLTGHVPEAMAQIQTLAQGQSNEAAEARAYLESKAAPSEKHP